MIYKMTLLPLLQNSGRDKRYPQSRHRSQKANTEYDKISQTCEVIQDFKKMKKDSIT